MVNTAPAQILAVSWTETAIGLTFYAMRLASNWKFTGRFRWDFAIATLAVLSEVTGQIFLQISVDSGMGQHIGDLEHTPEKIVAALKWGWVYQLLAIGASAIGKLAILAFLMQIRGRHESKPWALVVLGVLIAAVNITVMGTILGQCKPMAKLWDDSLEGDCDKGRLLNQNYSFFQASFNTFCDVALAVYPIYLFWKLQMKRRVKIGLAVLMGFGWIAAAASAVKTYELEALTKTDDITYALRSLLIWASTEAWIVIIVGCIPPCRPLMEKAFQLMGLTSKKTTPTPYGATPRSHGVFESGKANSPYSNLGSRTYDGRGNKQEDNLTWVELNDRDSSKEQIVNTGNAVMVTTDISTQYEDTQGSYLHSADSSHISREDRGHTGSVDVHKIV